MENKAPFHIATLIVKNTLGGLTSLEEKELSSWLKNDANNELYKSILSKDEFLNRQSRAKKINIDIEYKVFKKNSLEQKPVKKLIFNKILRYAAAIIIPIAIASGVWFITQEGFNNKYAGPRIPPGNQGAELILSNGQVIPLESDTSYQIKELDGTNIVKQSTTLSYKKTQSSITNNKALIYNRFNTKHGKESFVELSDGTKVWVNALSSLKYPVAFNKKNRTIELLHGEIYLEVTKNTDRPFYIKINDYTVKVLGTSLNISSYKNDDIIHTTLIEGLVEINSIMGLPKEKYLLKPDQQFSFNKSSLKAEVKDVNAAIYSSWIHGKFDFDEQTLEDMFKVFERWYNIEVFFDDETSKNEIFTGQLPRFEDMNIILDLIDDVSNVEFELNNNIILVKERK